MPIRLSITGRNFCCGAAEVVKEFSGRHDGEMSMHNRASALVAAALLSLVGVGAAAAADLPMKAPVMRVDPPFSWTGFYIGGYAGGLWGDKDWVEVVGPVPGGSIHPNYSGFIGGGQVGFNYQFDRWVFGIEGEWGGTNASGNTRCISSAAVTCGVELNWVAMLTGRVGFTVDRALIYAKGGGVWVQEDYPVAPGTPGAITLNNTRDGWTIGGGVEYAFTPNWSAKIEYNYLDLGTNRLNFAGAVEDITQRAHIAKIGLNYRFGMWR
jgi:outer membrane immunogenic protein